MSCRIWLHMFLVIHLYTCQYSWKKLVLGTCDSPDKKAVGPLYQLLKCIGICILCLFKMVFLVEFLKDGIIKLLIHWVLLKEKRKDGQWCFVRQSFSGEGNSNYGVVQLFGDIISKGPYSRGLEFHILFSHLMNYHLLKGNRT